MAGWCDDICRNGLYSNLFFILYTVLLLDILYLDDNRLDGEIPASIMNLNQVGE